MNPKSHKKNNRTSSFLFPLGLFFIFVACISSVLLVAIKAYGNMVNSAVDENYVSTALTYISEKIHHNDESGNIYITSDTGINGISQALVIEHHSGDVTYLTQIYYYDGNLCELVIIPESSVTASSGVRVIPISGLNMEYMDDYAIRFTCMDKSNNSNSMIISIRSSR